jgi:phosphate:Na+ symporter
MIISIIFASFSLVVFIIGIKLLSNGLINTVSKNIKKIIYRFTDTPIKGILTGTVFTAFIQSSSSATVIFISLLNARIISLEQSIGLIFGSNIGTTVTHQIISFNIENSALTFGISGLALYLVGMNQIKHVGKSLIGLCLLLYGLFGIKTSLGGLEDILLLKELLRDVSNSPGRGFLWGIIFTSIIQSSSAAGAVTISLAERGLINFNSAIAMVLGQNVGTCVTAFLASISGSCNGKRAAAAHFLFNFIGSVLAMAFFIPFLKTVAILITPFAISHQIANTHTMFNIINTLIFLPWINHYAHFLRWLIPDKDEC